MTEVVVLGGGYAGLRACKKLVKNKKINANITLVNNNSYHYDSTMLERVAAGTSTPEDITFTIRDVLDPKVKFIQDEVFKIDKDNNKITLKKHGEIPYDYLINSLGFQPNTYGIPGVKEYALGLSDIDNSVKAYQTLLQHLQTYKKTQDKEYLKIIVAGAGFTSIEYMGELIDKIPELAKRFGINKTDIKIICVGAEKRILPMFDDKLANYAYNFLEKKGVNFVLGRKITRVTEDGVEAQDEVINGKTVLWGTGVEGSEVVPISGYQSKRNQVLVNDDMTVPGYPNEYFIGDVAAVMNPATNRPFPTTGQIAIQEANIAVANLEAKLNHQPPVKFFYNSEGTVCSLGNTSGIAEVILLNKIKIKLKGYLVVPLKHMVAKKSTFELTGLKTALQSY